MSHSAAAPEQKESTIKQWYFKETVELEHQKKEAADERRHLEEQRESLLREKREFERRKEYESKKLEQEKRLFEMKWQILERELERLASDRAYVEQQKAFYERVTAYEEQEQKRTGGKIVNGEIFFTGIRNESALKKRYRDLIRIYHPDNPDGDTYTIQEINREYDDLRKQLG